ncbi:ATP-binding protein [Paenibacillus marinisediminis]
MRLSIKSKVSLSIACTVLLVFFVYIVLNYYMTKSKLVYEMEERMKVITQQISITMQQSYHVDEAIENMLAEWLYNTSKVAAKRLPLEYERITNNDLVDLTQDLGITHIALLQYTENKEDIIVSRSTDKNIEGLSTKEWDIWDTALRQLMDSGEVTLPQGVKKDNFWLGPFDRSASNPDHMDKWGYYYDGKRDYIISVGLQDSMILDTFYTAKPDQMVEQTLNLQPTVLEITAFNPHIVDCYDVIPTSPTINKVEFQTNRPILYGSYQYQTEQDKENIRKADQTGLPVFTESESHGQNLLKSFIPIRDEANNYVLSIVVDAQPMKATLKDQLLSNIIIGLVTLEIVFMISYMLAGRFIRPIQDILQKVNMLAIGRFHTPLIVMRKDELGTLAERINLMGDSLYQSTTQLRNLYEENRSMKDQLESFINQSTDAIHVTDLQGRVERVNQAFADMFGWTEEEIRGKQLPIIPDNLSKDIQEIEDLLQSGKAGGALETIRLTKDNRLLDVSVSTSPIMDDSGKPSAWASITRDITNRKQMEELLRRSEKLTTVGQLAAGVAHEIRNPLTTLKGFIQLQQRTGTYNPMHTSIMLSELDRINLIVGEFLVLSKPHAARFEEKDIRQVLQEVLTLMDSLAQPDGIYCVTRFADEVPSVMCEENQLKQVFINIIKNAIEALPQGGTIGLTVDTLDNGRVRVQVQDNGVGISPNDLPKIGDPFYTNKEKGTGLGLMVSQRIIYNHKGTFDVQSKLNEGTLITITLPAMEKAASEPNDHDTRIDVR